MEQTRVNLAKDEMRSMSSAAGRLLSYSRLFFGSFAVRREREKGWQFLYVILEGQQNGAIKKKTLTSGNEAFAQLVDHAADKFKALEPVLRDFNASKVFIEPIRTTAGQVREFRLTPFFDTAVETYLTDFYALYGVDIAKFSATWNDRKKRDILKTIFSFQYTRLYRSWTDLIGSLAGLSKIDHQDFALQITNRSPYWAIVFSCWKQYLDDPGIRFDLQSIDDEVKAIMLSSDPTEVIACFKFLTDDKVEFLVPVSGSNRQFRFNEIFGEAMINYNRDVRDLENELHNIALKLLHES